MTELTKTIKVELSDFIEYNQAHFKYRKKKMPYFRYIRWFTLLILIVIIGFQLENTTFSFNQKGIVIDLLIMLFVVSFIIPLFFLSPISKRKAVTKAYKSNKSLQKPYTIKFDNNGIDYTSDIVNSSIKWDGIIRVIETSKAYYFYDTEITSHMLLKRYFDSPDEDSFIKELIKTHLPAEKLIQL